MPNFGYNKTGRKWETMASERLHTLPIRWMGERQHPTQDGLEFLPQQARLDW